jgi:hypothetical protein
VAPTSSGYGNPSIAWSGSSVIITASAGSAGLDYWYEPYGTATWHQQTVTSSCSFEEQGALIAATSSAAVISGIDNTNDPGNVDYHSQPFGTSGWPGQTIASGCC